MRLTQNSHRVAYLLVSKSAAVRKMFTSSY